MRSTAILKLSLLALIFSTFASTFAQGQLVVTILNSDGSETALGSVYGWGQVAVGDTKVLQFRVRNSGTSTANLAWLSLSAPAGPGANPFSIVNPPSLPASLASGRTLDFSVQFSSPTINSYSATLQVNSQSVILLASAVGTPVLTAASPCKGPDASGAIAFAGASCTFTLQNPTPKAFPVSPLTLSGAAFSGLPASYVNGVTLPASQSIAFTILYTSSTAGNGTLVIGPKTYALSGAPAAVGGGLLLSVVDGSGMETPLSANYDFGQVAAGDNRDVHFRARNPGPASTQITSLKVTNPGAPSFALLNAPTVSLLQPYTLAVPPSPSDHLDYWIRFNNATAGAYAGTATLNTQTFSLSANAVAAAKLTVAAPCTGPDANNSVNFGRMQQSTQVSCVFTLSNPSAQSLTVSPVVLSGTAFTGVDTTNVQLAGNQSIQNKITFIAALPQVYSEILTLGPRSYTLTGTGFSAPIATPNISFDSSVIKSGEQHTLTISLPSAAGVSSSGILTMTFKPQVATVMDDAAVQFVATSKRAASLAFTAGSMAVTINGQPNIVFSTGTTAGQITFSLSDGIYGFSGDPTTVLTLPPTAIAISSASATRKLGELDLALSGFDNTYSAGLMTFKFLDKTGAALGSSLNADFTSNFQKFYQGQSAGSAFLMGVAFPVVGDSSVVTAVEMTLKNSAGNVTPARLNFP